MVDVPKRIVEARHRGDERKSSPPPPSRATTISLNSVKSARARFPRFYYVSPRNFIFTENLTIFLEISEKIRITVRVVVLENANTYSFVAFNCELCEIFYSS